MNDYFEFFTEGIDGYTVWLKDPWGVLVYEYDKSTGKWDGLTTGGKEAPAGPYYYHLAARDFVGQALDRSGVVYLIRDLIELSPIPAKDKRCKNERTLAG
ncbi:MAG: gliding motility-associated C-terminal domain-containing protein [Bacteroidales bacterium]|nr:gliding motility-associated C-terminal domain-containing protein [Bacteroidales bacterium]